MCGTRASLSQFEEDVERHTRHSGEDAQELVEADGILEQQESSQEGHTELAVAYHIVPAAALVLIILYSNTPGKVRASNVMGECKYS